MVKTAIALNEANSRRNILTFSGVAADIGNIETATCTAITEHNEETGAAGATGTEFSAGVCEN